MRMLALLFLVVQAGEASSPSTETMGRLMIDPISPDSDPVFHIETRTPGTVGDWRAPDAKTAALAEAGKAVAGPAYFPERTRWMDDANATIQPRSATASDVAPAPTGDKRDLDGVWSFGTLTPLERPAELAGKLEFTAQEATAYEAQTIDRNNRDRRGSSPEADVGGAYNEAWFDRGSVLTSVNGKKRTSLIVDPPDGKIPAPTAPAREKAAARAADRREHPSDDPENQGLPTRCLLFGAGPPIVPGPYNNFVQILQFSDHVIIFNEMIHDARIVPLDGRPHVAPAIRRWLGDSRGRWEGNTLVVDTTNFTDKTNFRGADENLHVIERFTRTSPDTLLYEFTVDNRTAFTKPWSTQMTMTKSDNRIFEYACHEANYAMTGILRGARAEERRKP